MADKKSKKSKVSDPNSETISTLEAAQICGVSVFSIQRWFDAGHLTGGKLPGGKRLIDRKSLDKFIEDHKIKAVKPVETK